MNPIDPAKLSMTQRLHSGAVSPLTRTAPARAVPNSAGEARPQVATTALSGPTAGAEPPVDGDRVEQIRKAVEEGSYPLLPTRIADAMIAAGYLLRASK